jgi:tRNA (mo5U34)-methyltransferase
MAERSWRWRGYALTLSIPNRRRGGLVVGDRPKLRPAARDPEEAIAFVREAIDQDRQGLWYHTIELPGGEVMEGVFDHRRLLDGYGLPEDLRGARALDVASYDGFWALELERRGADVTSVDIASTSDVDLPPAARELLRERGWEIAMGRRFAQARERTGSRIRALTASVYELDADELGTFDFVHAGDLLVHLRDPVLALQRMRAVTGGQALISDCYDPELEAPGLARYLGGWQWATWWMPSLPTLVQMVADAGFSDTEVVTTYNLATRDQAAGPWRAVIRARP